MPTAQQDQRIQRRRRFADPVERHRPAKNHGEDTVDRAVRAKELGPDDGDRHTAAEQRRDIIHRAVKTNAAMIAGQHHRHAQRSSQAQRHQNEHILERNAYGFPEHAVLEHVDVVIEPIPLRITQAVKLGEGKIQGIQHGNGGKYQQAKQPWRNKRQTGKVISPSSQARPLCQRLFHGCRSHPDHPFRLCVDCALRRKICSRRETPRLHTEREFSGKKSQALFFTRPEPSPRTRRSAWRPLPASSRRRAQTGTWC